MKSNVNPLVSVLTTCYNREIYLGQAIESVLASTFRDFELIIVDDKSTDGSLEIARRYEKMDSRIKVFTNDVNLGDYPNRNKAASFAKGKYLKYLDSDDIIYPFGLEIMVSRMEAFPEAAVGFSQWGLKSIPFPVLLKPEEAYRWSFLEGGYLFTNAPSSAIIRRSAFETLGGFSGLNQMGDVEFWLKIAARFPLLLMEGGTNFARDHESSEKYKDNTETKHRMLFNLNKTALESPDNPLSTDEKGLALSLLQKQFFRKLVKQRLRRWIGK
ncbi:MAG TPA: glycosyltransferase family 2 protein [Ferruginibacter sp.]|nr:glycosyltransferase family 2 protein [Ferruginibacter sp.]HRO16577.1 glycosyltransferase family 2 protein [Ferruginibacter sp.]HRQ19914.1 glycosyltransferase family 2 protein [Ferruginibacter sp.]